MSKYFSSQLIHKPMGDKFFWNPLEDAECHVLQSAMHLVGKFFYMVAVFDFYIYDNHSNLFICVHLYDTFQTENVQYPRKEIIQIFFQ